MSQRAARNVSQWVAPTIPVIVKVLLDRNVGEGDAEAQGAAPPILRKGG